MQSGHVVDHANIGFGRSKGAGHRRGISIIRILYTVDPHNMWVVSYGSRVSLGWPVRPGLCERVLVDKVMRTSLALQFWIYHLACHSDLPNSVHNVYVGSSIIPRPASVPRWQCHASFQQLGFAPQCCEQHPGARGTKRQDEHSWTTDAGNCQWP
jgi:hypothetical protein